MSADQPEQQTGHSRALVLVVLLPVLLLAPFANKAFHIDDTVYIWVAQQIQDKPLDFFGFEKNWDDRLEPAHAFNKNPPGVSYLIALAALVVGWNELGLHLVFIIPSVLAGLGVFFLAKRFCDRPLLAATIAIVSPAFIVSGTNLMCEATMLALYTWSVVLWVRGLDAEDSKLLGAAAILMGAGFLVKFVAISVVPLLVAYTLLSKRRATVHLLYFLIPLGVLVAYDAFTFAMYGTPHFLNAALFSLDYATAASDVGFVQKLLTNTSFMGGGFILTFFLVPFLWSWRGVLSVGAAYLVILLMLISSGGIGSDYLMYDGPDIRWGYVLQLALFLTAGLNILAMLVADVRECRDRDATLLLLWIGGIFVFSAFFNWAVNIRALLPMAPAVALLAARRFRAEAGPGTAPARPILPIVAAVCVSLAVARADYGIAESSREAATRIDTLIGKQSGTTWYQGQGGVRYYMEQKGYRALDADVLRGEEEASTPGAPFDFDAHGFANKDRIVTAETSKFFNVPADNTVVLGQIAVESCTWAATMNRAAGAGFYWYSYGPLPYYFGNVGPETYTIHEVVAPGE